MAIFRMQRYKKNFTIIGNEIINNEDLSAMARFILMYLLSKPQDWKVSARRLEKGTGLSREKIGKCLRELEVNHYAELQRIQYDNGKFAGTYWAIADSPVLNMDNGNEFKLLGPLTDESVK